MENAGYIFAAFAIVWLVVFGYVLVLFSRQRRLQKEIDVLKKVVDKKQSEQ